MSVTDLDQVDLGTSVIVQISDIIYRYLKFKIRECVPKENVFNVIFYEQ